MNPIDTCAKCDNRKFDRLKGTICGLTDAKPTFENICNDFEIDPKVSNKIEKIKAAIRPNAERAKAVIYLLMINAIINLLNIYSDYLEYNLLLAAKTGQNVTLTMTSANDKRQQIIGVVTILVYIVTVVFFIRWFRRAYFNLNQRVDNCAYTEATAAWCWFVPIICLYYPYQIMKELYTETRNLISKYDAPITQLKSTTLIGIWWTIWIITNYIGNYVLKTSFKADTIESLMHADIANIISTSLTFILTFIIVKIIKDFNSMEVSLLEIEKVKSN